MENRPSVHTYSVRREYVASASKHDRNPATLPLVGTVQGFLPGFTRHSLHVYSPCMPTITSATGVPRRSVRPVTITTSPEPGAPTLLIVM